MKGEKRIPLTALLCQVIFLPLYPQAKAIPEPRIPQKFQLKKRLATKNPPKTKVKRCFLFLYKITLNSSDGAEAL